MSEFTYYLYTYGQIKRNQHFTMIISNKMQNLPKLNSLKICKIITAWLFLQARIHSWNQPVLSNKGLAFTLSTFQTSRSNYWE